MDCKEHSYKVQVLINEAQEPETLVKHISLINPINHSPSKYS